MNNKTMVIVAIAIVIIAIMFLYLANGQSQSQTNNAGKKSIPVLLIHGYLSDASVWKKWEGLLKKDGIPFYPITFYKSDDKCGSAADHAKELDKQVQQVIRMTGSSKQVNIVGYSKGGLDARVYLANDTTKAAIANLIMIGTPNGGSPIAIQTINSNICRPVVNDLKAGAEDTTAAMNPNTKYYTIAGDWNSLLVLNCPQLNWLPIEEGGYPQLPKPNDGMVSVSSVESQRYFHNLGHTSDCDSNLLSDKEYGLAKPILLKR